MTKEQEIKEIDDKLDRIEDDESTINLLFAKTELQDNLIQEQQAEIEKKDKLINTLTNLSNKLKLIAGLALKGRPLEISRKAYNELENTIEIEQTENMMNDSFIFRAR